MARPRSFEPGKSKHCKYRTFGKTCTSCGKTFLITSRNILRRQGRKRPTDICEVCLRAQDNQTRFGENYEEWKDDVNAKRKKTVQKHYGVDHQMRSKKVKQKVVATTRKCYGVDNVAHCPEIVEKRKATMRKRHGVDYSLSSAVLRKKARQTTFKRFGVENVALLPENQAKLHSAETQAKRKATMLTRFGVDSMFKLKNFHDMRRKGCIRNSGEPEPQLRKSGKSEAEKSITSKLMFICTEGLLKDKHLVVCDDPKDNTTCITVHGVLYSHSWDITIRDQSGSLILVIDYDGDYYHGEKFADYDAIIQAEYKDTERFMTIPKGVMWHIINENGFDTAIEDVVKILGYDYSGFLKSLYDFACSIQFPFCKDYPEYYNDKTLLGSWHRLCNYGEEDITKPRYKYYNYDKLEKVADKSRTGGKLINYFHPSIYKCRSRDKPSPYEAWHHVDENGDRNLLMKAIKNRMIYSARYQPFRILQGFSNSYIAPKVTVFSPSRARLYLHKYARKFNTVFDPFMGYSGRMLGALSLEKNYIGSDINPTIFEEAGDIVKWLDKNKELAADVCITCKDILTYERGTQYECLFTCPPYKDLEIWWDDLTQTEIRSNNTAEEWVMYCLEMFECTRYIFVVDARCNKFQPYVVHICNSIIENKYNSYKREKVLVIDFEDRNRMGFGQQNFKFSIVKE